MIKDKDQHYMRMALSQAREAARQGEVPVGAVVVLGEEVLGQGYNMRERLQDPTAHAEIIAIREAAEACGSWRLQGSEMYVTLEPCPMCAGAIIQARVARLVYGAPDPKAGAVVSLLNLFDVSGFNHAVEVQGGILAEDSAKILQKFFQDLRSGRVSESG